MGCVDAKEKLQQKISLLKLAKFQIEKERQENLKNLEKIEGHPISRTPIPDYIIHDNNSIEDEDNIINEEKINDSNNNISDENRNKNNNNSNHFENNDIVNFNAENMNHENCFIKKQHHHHHHHNHHHHHKIE